MNVLGVMLKQSVIAKRTTGNSCGNEAPFCGRRAIIEGEVQPLER